MNIQHAIRTVVEGGNLSSQDMMEVMRQIMTGEATDAQIGGFLIGLRMKGETVDEVVGAATVMRELSSRVHADVEHLVDTCGTGGDASGTFNVSTAAALVAAAAGANVAKHGNRSVSSASGSADVLEAAGVDLDLTPEQVGACIEKVGIGFLFAPAHHKAMRYAIGPRKEMGVRTIFNVLGPLTNPAGAPNQVIGVFDENWVEHLARVLGELGSRHVMVVHAADGLAHAPVTGSALDLLDLQPRHIAGARIDMAALELVVGTIALLAARVPLEGLEVVAEQVRLAPRVIGREGLADAVALHATVRIGPRAERAF